MNKTDTAWQILFERHHILENIDKDGFYQISANEIRKVREPRLMAKFDHYRHLPKIFKENRLSILPISRSSYLIGRFKVYEPVLYNENLRPIQVSLPTEITTVDPTNIYSESVALHCAYVTGMIDNLLEEKSFQTVSGRMTSKVFSFRISSHTDQVHNITIQNSQIEIDGGFESSSKFMVVEAKNGMVEDFLVRQLYYPFRLWQSKITKRIVPVFFTYSNDIFSFFIYEFIDPFDYNSLQLIEQRDFIIDHEDIEMADIVELWQSVQVIPEPAIPFPQADSFPRIVDLLGLLVEENLSKDQITRNYDFDARQTNYYATAGMYLGLIERYRDEDRQVMFRLTPEGRDIMRLNTKEKFLRLAKAILIHEPFKQVLGEYLQTNALPDRERVVQIMKHCELYNIHSESTYYRRASTVISWINWIIKLPEIY